MLTFDAALEKRMQEARKANHPANPQTHEEIENILRNSDYGCVSLYSLIKNESIIYLKILSGKQNQVNPSLVVLYTQTWME